jgi:death on curing protein
VTLEGTSRALPVEPRWITETTLLAMHAQQVERYGGAHGILDENVVLSALARPVNRWSYDESADLADLAGSYLVGFARSQGFCDGNKRTALATALVFLAINGHPLHAPPSELYALTMAVANNRADDAAVSMWFRAQLSASPSP